MDERRAAEIVEVVSGWPGPVFLKSLVATIWSYLEDASTWTMATVQGLIAMAAGLAGGLLALGCVVFVVGGIIGLLLIGLRAL